MNSSTWSLIGDAHFLEFAALNGFEVFKGMHGKESCDYVALTPGGSIRVEVKFAGQRAAENGRIRYVPGAPLNTDHFDYLYFVTPIGDYFIPAADCAKRVFISSDGTHKYERFRIVPPDMSEERGAA